MTGTLSGKVFAVLNESYAKKVFHDLFFRNAFLLRLIGLKMPPLYRSLSYGMNYADLTTYLLSREISGRLASGEVRKAHEIGIGQYGILSLYTRKKFPSVAITGSTISPEEAANSKKVAEYNGCEIQYSVSDVLAQVKGAFDLIWWNLPYYDPEVLSYLDRLFRQVKDNPALRPGGVVLIGFNSVPLNEKKVLELVSRHPHLRIQKRAHYFWNPHVLLALEYIPGKQN